MEEAVEKTIDTRRAWIDAALCTFAAAIGGYVSIMDTRTHATIGVALLLGACFVSFGVAFAKGKFHVFESRWIEFGCAIIAVSAFLGLVFPKSEVSMYSRGAIYITPVFLGWVFFLKRELKAQTLFSPGALVLLLLPFFSVIAAVLFL